MRIDSMMALGAMACSLAFAQNNSEVLAKVRAEGLAGGVSTARFGLTGPMVKGAPYSAEGVTETSQTLGDGLMHGAFGQGGLEDLLHPSEVERLVMFGDEIDGDLADEDEFQSGKAHAGEDRDQHGRPHGRTHPGWLTVRRVVDDLRRHGLAVSQ